MTSYINPCDDCTRCIHCERRWCRAENVSPGEAIDLCLDCWSLTEVTC